jgi:hypothetical protein
MVINCKKINIQNMLVFTSWFATTVLVIVSFSLFCAEQVSIKLTSTLNAGVLIYTVDNAQKISLLLGKGKSQWSEGKSQWSDFGGRIDAADYRQNAEPAELFGAKRECYEESSFIFPNLSGENLKDICVSSTSGYNLFLIRISDINVNLLTDLKQYVPERLLTYEYKEKTEYKWFQVKKGDDQYYNIEGLANENINRYFMDTFNNKKVRDMLGIDALTGKNLLTAKEEQTFSVWIRKFAVLFYMMHNNEIIYVKPDTHINEETPFLVTDILVHAKKDIIKHIFDNYAFITSEDTKKINGNNTEMDTYLKKIYFTIVPSEQTGYCKIYLPELPMNWVAINKEAIRKYQQNNTLITSFMMQNYITQNPSSKPGFHSSVNPSQSQYNVNQDKPNLQSQYNVNQDESHHGLWYYLGLIKIPFVYLWSCMLWLIQSLS